MRPKFKDEKKMSACRVRDGFFGSNDSYGLVGAFRVDWKFGPLTIISSNDENWIEEFGDPWEHVSVSKEKNPPNWAEMCYIKDLFWRPSETVIQFHTDYVNVHKNCLHLWKPPYEIVLPPFECV